MRPKKDARERLTEGTERGDGAGCWLWRGYTVQDGYGRFRANGRMTLAHRLAYELENGPIPPGLCVLHTCDTPACVRPDHLRLGTHSENMQDMVTKKRGRRPDLRGEKSPNAKLTAEQVAAIRRLCESFTQCQVADMFGVSKANVSSIVRRKAWKHLA